MLDALYTNGRFYTQDPTHPWASSLGVFRGRIVGVDDDIAGLKARETHDLQGAFVAPGFNDAHHHLSSRGQKLRWVDLRFEAAGSLDTLYAAVAERAKTTPDGEWVFGAGYDQNKVGSHPTAEMLDKAAPGHPVWLVHVSGHFGVANTAAFERAGFSGRAGVPDVAGGGVRRDERGLALGLLEETAQSLITEAFQPFPESEVVASIAAGSAQALSEGLTSVTEPGVGRMSPMDLHAFQQARDSGALGLRMTVMPFLTDLHDLGMLDGGSLGLDLGLRSGFGDEWLRIGPAKVMTDGSLIGKTAAMHEHFHGEEANKGYMRMDPDELRALVVKAHRCGWQIAAHAIGDAAIDHALDSFAAAQQAFPREDVRHRIEHFAVASPEQVARTAALGVIAVPQGRFISELGDGMIAALGPDRVANCYRMKSLLDAGIELPGSSDAPVSNGAPLLGIHDMVNRKTASGEVLAPSERVTIEEAIRAYTIGSAYAAHEEAEKGTLERGKLADFVVLSEDLLSIDAEGIRDVEVTGVVVGGELVVGIG